VFRLLIALLIFPGCVSSRQHTDTSTHVSVHERQYYFIDESAPSQGALQSAVDAAISGDDAKLAYIISLARFSDGESALNFGDLLLQICHAVGMVRFQSAMATLPRSVQEGADGCMKAAERTRRAYEQYTKAHPKT
jgi:hypothetical protein